MSNNNVINEKKKALLAYKEKILEEIKCYEKSIDDFQTDHKNNSFYDDYIDSSDSEDDFPHIKDTGPSIVELNMQQTMMKTCLQATQELTSLTVLQSEVCVMVEEPKLEGERPVTEDGTWREVTAECRIDLVPFTMNFYMHTPTRKFAPRSYRGLRVMPVKSAHELELAKSVLHDVKLPSDAIEVLKSYATGYRSRRTTLARLANKYTNSLFMEPHAEGGFVLKCADLLEVSWRLQNKWSPVAPFHHRMKFDLEYMDESYIKIITQAHKQLLDPAIQTDERTLLLAKIISTCLEARGPVDPESDLESKTTERDIDIEKRDSESEKRDSEVMAPPKSLPKKVKQKNKNSLPNPAQKRSMNEDDRNDDAKKMRNSEPSAGIKNSANSNRKHTINYEVNEGAKKRKIIDVDNKKKVASNKNIKKTDNADNTGNIQPKNLKDTGNVENKTKTKNDKETVKTKAKNVKETDYIETKDVNSQPESVKENGNKNKKNTYTKAKNLKETIDICDKNTKTNPKNVIETANADDKGNNTKTKNKTVKETEKNKNIKATTNEKNKMVKESNVKDKNNIKDDNNEMDKANGKKNKVVKEPSDVGKVNNIQPKKSSVKEVDNLEKNANTKNIEKKMPKKVSSVKSKENVDANRISEKVPTKEVDLKTKAIEKNINVAKTKNTEVNQLKKKPVTTKSKENVAKTKKDQEVLKDSEKNKNSKEKLPTNSAKNLKEKPILNLNTVKKVVEKHATNKIKDKISPITNRADKVDKDKQNLKEIPPNIAISQNFVAKKNKDFLINKKVNKQPIKKVTHIIASHRNPLKVQNPQKSTKPINTKLFNTGNTEKENGAKISKIPQKKLSPISEGSSKKNLLRISPRKLPSKFKSTQKNTYKQVIMKSTNIPRLLKKPSAKCTQQ